ncbi:hypothetical protein EX895_005328 [Sporisorium graminicola]|uniref:Copper-fist domain-containing protein n=1 Tax=Sporisorium graminicola TaxID=280036 RepID=A0A4U7KRF2_9BASI|nr:hypothetical protein EX895_005328 [Sporisorium graminicola]TKY85788.1 hypothetical protein EX895_005328 [Sporisorium graminicola]
MTATTATVSRPSSFFSQRYSDTMISPPRSREPSHTPAYSSAASTSYARCPAALTMSFSTPSPPAHKSAELGNISPFRRASLGDAPLDAASATGVKYACAACIRGHRTSSCAHKDGSKGPLYPIRSKGRPPTQCEICRKKRKESGRHVRCDCSGKKASSAATSTEKAAAVTHKRPTPAKSNVPILPRIADDASSSESTDDSDDHRPSKKTKVQGAAISTPLVRAISNEEPYHKFRPQPPALDNILAPIRPHRAPTSWSLPSIHPPHSALRIQPSSESDQDSAARRHSTLSLSSLMNPCGCRSTGARTCCSDQRQRGASISSKQLNGAPQDCDPAHCSCSSDSCRQQMRVANAVAGPSQVATSSGCSGKGASASAAPSIELLLRAVDMSTEFVPPPCACSENCGCARCLAKQDATSAPVSMAQPRPTSNRASSTRTTSSASPRTPPATLDAPGCDDCAACDLALERPSGIGAVDSWMEKQRDLDRRPTSLPSPQRRRSSSAESRASRRSSQADLPLLLSQQAVPTSSVPTMHGGFVTSGPETHEEVRAELVLVHPKCAACLEIVRSKGVGVLSSVK